MALPSHVNATSIRYDQVVNARSSLLARYSETPSVGQTNQVSSFTQNHVRSRTVTLGVSNSLSTSMKNEFLLGYATNESESAMTIQPNYQSSGISVNPVSLLGVPAGYGGVRGQVYLHVDGAGDSLIQTYQASGSFTQWKIGDISVLSLRNHLVRVGFDERRLARRLLPHTVDSGCQFFRPHRP